MLLWGTSPELYGFAADDHHSGLARLLSAPVHLTDDVMITLRSGNVLAEKGLPAFNNSDVAQASSSYLTPFVFAGLYDVVPSNLAVLSFALIGFLLVVLTLLTIAVCSKSRVIGIALALLLCLTQTNLDFGLNGWEHLYQGFFLTLATAMVLRSQTIKPITLGLCLALGVLFRADGILLAGGILISVLLNRDSTAKQKILCGGVFLGTVMTLLAYNFYSFGSLTPTTARLKLGTSPSLTYSVTYLLNNGLLAYTSLTLLVGLLILTLVIPRIIITRQTLPIVGGVVLTIIAAAYNSDVFPGARMFWSASCVMCMVVGARIPKNTLSKISITEFSTSHKKPFTIISVTLLLLIISLTVNLSKRQILSPWLVAGAHQSDTSAQFQIAQWLDRNLNPGDGAIGLYYLGISYHLPRFEIADFLGKADEMIAQSPVKWGPPGHNKWDTEQSLGKWNPQVIIPAKAAMLPASAEDLARAQRVISKKKDWGFSADLLLNKKVREKYDYCYLKNPVDKWGFYLRKDISARHGPELNCFSG